MTRYPLTSASNYILTPNLPFNKEMVSKYIMFDDDRYNKKEEEVMIKFEREILNNVKNLQILFRLAHNTREKYVEGFRTILRVVSRYPQFQLNQPFKFEDEMETFLNLEFPKEKGRTVDGMDRYLKRIKVFVENSYNNEEIDLDSVDYQRHCDTLDDSLLENENCLFSPEKIGTYKIHAKSYGSEGRKNLFTQFDSQILTNEEVLKIIFKFRFSLRVKYIRVWKQILSLMADWKEYDFSRNIYLDEHYVSDQMNLSVRYNKDSYNNLVKLLELVYGQQEIEETTSTTNDPNPAEQVANPVQLADSVSPFLIDPTLLMAGIEDYNREAKQKVEELIKNYMEEDTVDFEADLVTSVDFVTSTISQDINRFSIAQNESLNED
ncbi:uncharacterized protein KGF55_005467 [Candida pseudojiufengensis]|uniref:uncharacterized protein n=1 Tax=Candida pseudojiufengensis TaxID=497109 RepID=UPI0022247DEC|nr:uncharacterized protein KGF55_005467 [Candida pseudojiufengensis]KAI5959317.1 hypothetical protein KGF55_005467 [Candida pseudojiufengensis]